MTFMYFCHFYIAGKRRNLISIEMFLNEKYISLNIFLSAIAKLVKFGLKSALKKICEKELSEGKLFCFRKEAVKLFLSAKAVMVLRSHQKIVKFDGANYSTQLPYFSKY